MPDSPPGSSAPWRAVAAELRALVVLLGRILLRHGLPLLGIGALGLTASFWMQQLAVVVSRADALLGLLVFALVPAISFGTVAWMMLHLGRPAPSLDHTRGRIAVLGSALLVYLLIYEQSGQLREERRSYLWETVYEAIWSGDTDATSRIPDLLSVPTLTVVAVAFGLRMLGSRLVQRLEERPGASRGLVTLLRLLVGYAEIVWIVLAVLSLFNAWDNLATWWDSRVVVHAVTQWWAGLALPDLPALVGSIASVVGTLVAALTRGVLVPLVWLVLASLLYGVRFGDVTAVPTYLARLTASAGNRLGGVGRRVLRRDVAVDPAALERSWRRLTEPEGRWDALGGALGLVLARGPVAVLVYCVVFLALSQVDLLLWELVGLAFANRPMSEWALIVPTAGALATLLPMVLAVATAAAGADLALRNAGLSSPLRRGISHGTDGAETTATGGAAGASLDPTGADAPGIGATSAVGAAQPSTGNDQ